MCNHDYKEIEVKNGVYTDKVMLCRECDNQIQTPIQKIGNSIQRFHFERFKRV